MINTGRLAGRTVFITGASRGIGKAIALKCAKDGANIVVAAKTVEQHPKLPGTIYSAAKEIEQAGGKALACVVDIRDEQQIDKAIEQTIDRFGGIDVLVNNASAISLTNTQQTPIKRFDLMLNINARGTYLVSQKCLPYLMKGKNPHILTLSPPLNMLSVWFKDHLAYTMSKYGMSMCVLGMAEEFRSKGIAVNSLWPSKAIWTAAIEMLLGAGAEMSKGYRKPEIMADAAYAILIKNCREFTGNFAIDDEVLRKEGVIDFDQYAVKPGHELIPDIFLGDEEAHAKLERIFTSATEGGSIVKQQQMKASRQYSSESGSGSVGDVFVTLKKTISTDLVKQINGIFSFQLTGSQSGKYFIDLKRGQGSCGGGDPEGETQPDVTFSMDSADFVKMFRGELKPSKAFIGGNLKIQGDMGLAMKLEKLLGQLKSKL